MKPGLTTLWVGRLLHLNNNKLDRVEMAVGGVSASPFNPYGYAVTWSLDDLQEEYIRPARFICGGKRN